MLSESEGPFPHNQNVRCPVYGVCGGCSSQHLSYEDELKLKEKRIHGLFKEVFKVDQDCLDPIVASPRSYAYRHRLDLKMIRSKVNGLLLGFTPLSRRGIVTVDACPIAMEAVSDFLPDLKVQIQQKLQEKPKYKRANITVRTGEDGRVHWGGLVKVH